MYAYYVRRLIELQLCKKSACHTSNSNSIHAILDKTSVLPEKDKLTLLFKSTKFCKQNMQLFAKYEYDLEPLLHLTLHL